VTALEPIAEAMDSSDPRRRAREVLGVTGDVDAPPLRTVMRGRVGWYPLCAISALVLATELYGFAVVVLGPDIARSLGLSASTLAALLSAKLLAVAVATLPMAALVQHRARRAAICVITAFIWTGVAALTAFVVGPWGLAIVLIVDGLATGSVRVLHQPLLMDSYPTEARMRVLSAYQAAATGGSVLAPLVVAALSGWAALTWRGTMLAVALVSLATTLVAVKLRDPGVGRWDSGRIRDVVRSSDAAGADPAVVDGRNDPPAEHRLGFGEVVRRLLLIPTVRRALVAQAVFGLLLVPYTTFLLFFLEERWNFDAPDRAIFFAASSIGGIVALRWFAPRAERRFRRDPADLVRHASWLLLASVVLVVPAALSPALVPMVLLFAASSALGATVGPALAMTMFSIVPARFRPHLAALGGIYLAGVGGFAGALLLGSLDRRFGVGGALVGVVVPGVAGALILRSAARTVNQDLNRMIDEFIDDEAVAERRRHGTDERLLDCRGLDFSYGQVQVLFGVEIRVDEGEIVALLGTNGAGKSTVLRVVSGLGLPSRGSVRFDGLDITWLDAERRVPLGIVQVPGGRSAFGPMTVLDNLLVHAHSVGRGGSGTRVRVERAFEAFPRLYERRHQIASTLSGGEQQMLALSKAVILEPKLLLIDELSLGLAPKVVGELLESIREIHRSGTSIVLVEQSVNLALSVATRAYFMERGAVRFEGPTADLIGRDDLLRSVFLGGAAESSP
jgi:ABC-type branched-subunit amino acid transport system ATPase component/predicted MFS family arabinose efflux permease